MSHEVAVSVAFRQYVDIRIIFLQEVYQCTCENVEFCPSQIDCSLREYKQYHAHRLRLLCLFKVH